MRSDALSRAVASALPPIPQAKPAVVAADPAVSVTVPTPPPVERVTDDEYERAFEEWLRERDRMERSQARRPSSPQLGRSDPMWLSYQQVAERLNVNPRTIRRMVDRGEFPKPQDCFAHPSFYLPEVEAWEKKVIEQKNREAK